MKVHNFHERLAMSEQASDAGFWDAVYRQAFPTMVNHMMTTGDTISQRMGIDRIVHLASGRTLYIDEKKREKVYEDILLEYVSVDTTNAPGWIEKELLIDYLAYAFMPLQRVYLLPWDMLQRAWKQNKREWLETYRKVEAQNRNYKTLSVPIPINVLQESVKNASIIQLSWVNEPDTIAKFWRYCQDKHNLAQPEALQALTVANIEAYLGTKEDAVNQLNKFRKG